MKTILNLAVLSFLLASSSAWAEGTQLEYKVLSPKVKLQSHKTTTTAYRSAIRVIEAGTEVLLPDDTDVSHREIFKNRYNSGFGLGLAAIFPQNPYLSLGTGLKYTTTEMKNTGLEGTIFDGDTTGIGLLGLQEFARSSWNWTDAISTYVQGGLSVHQIYAHNQTISQYQFPVKSYSQSYSPLVTYDLAIGARWSFASWALALDFEGSNTLLSSQGRLRSKQVMGMTWDEDPEKYFFHSYKSKVEGLKLSSETVSLTFVQYL